MLPSSLRRVASGRSAAAGLAASTTPRRASVIASASAPVIVCGHQRRFSSSKPSRSDNGSSEIPARESVPASRPGESKTAGDKRKRKNKDSAGRDASLKKLPSVPNTHHMSYEALGLSSFFSLHRPISVTQMMPRTVSDAQFASIFAPRSKGSRVSDTMSTISNTIDQLEAPMAQMTISGQEEQLQHGTQRLDIRNPDGSESSVHFQVDAMSGRFLPFRPPPLPQAESVTETEEANAAEPEVSDQGSRHRVFKAMFTIEESTEANGHVRIIAHSPRIVNEDQPRSFLERMVQRQLRFDETRSRRASGVSADGVDAVDAADATEEEMHAISVLRQRKLKMKKHKYKKLRKRTRNLRRKLAKK